MQEQEVADAFVAGRQLTGDRGILDVAHEALFRQWAPLHHAVVARSEELRRPTELERWARDWDRAERQDAYLLTGERLSVARQWLAESGRALGTTPLVKEFVDRSLRADRATMERAADTVALRALQSVDAPEPAVLAALAAVAECAATPAAVQALHTALGASRLRAVLRGFERSASGVAWSPDAQRLAVSSDDGTVRVWRPECDDQPVVLEGDGAWMQAVAWSPDGLRLAVGCRDTTVRVWSTSTWSELAVLRHMAAADDREEGVGGVAWSPDGTRLASVGSDCAVRIWDTDTYAESAVLRGHQHMVWSVTWSPDGKHLASGGEESTVRVWAATIPGCGTGPGARGCAVARPRRRRAVHGRAGRAAGAALAGGGGSGCGAVGPVGVGDAASAAAAGRGAAAAGVAGGVVGARSAPAS